jgi:hypothetical protein
MIDYWSHSLPEEMHEVYDRVSPDGPEHFPVVLEKMMRMWREEPDIALSELAGVRAPVLLMQGDDNIVKVEHSAALAATLPAAQLAVIPGGSHRAAGETRPGQPTHPRLPERPTAGEGDAAARLELAKQPERRLPGGQSFR